MYVAYKPQMLNTITGVINKEVLKWTGHVTRIECKTNAHKASVVKLEGKKQPGKRGVRRKNKIKINIGRNEMFRGMHWTGSKNVPLSGSRESALWGSAKDGEFTEQLSNCKVVNKDNSLGFVVPCIFNHSKHPTGCNNQS